MPAKIAGHALGIAPAPDPLPSTEIEALRAEVHALKIDVEITRRAVTAYVARDAAIYTPGTPENADFDTRLAACKAHVAAGAWPAAKDGGVTGDVRWLIDQITALRAKYEPTLPPGWTSQHTASWQRWPDSTTRLDVYLGDTLVQWEAARVDRHWGDYRLIAEGECETVAEAIAAAEKARGE